MTVKIPLGQIPRFRSKPNPHDLCIVFPEKRLTWRELDFLSTERATQIKTEGVDEGDFVSILLPNCAEFFEITFAAWKLGATPHPISPSLTRTEIDDQLAFVRPKVVLSRSGVIRRFGDAYERLQHSDEIKGQDGASADGKDRGAVSVCWKAISSGGSTGRPKVIVDMRPGLFQPNAINQIFASITSRLSPGDALLLTGPLHHATSFVRAHHALCEGAKVVGMPVFDAEEVLRQISEHQITHVTLVPTMMHRIWRLAKNVRERYDISSLKAVTHTAAPMPSWLKEEWINWLGPERVLEIYGSTEALGYAVITGKEWLKRRGSVGKLLPGASLKILDADGNEAVCGGIGEIAIRPNDGPGTTYRYIGAASKDRDRFGFEKTGDMGWVDEQGYLYLADRNDDMIISGGVNIFPAEIEATLSEHPAVESVVVIGLPDSDLGERVHALLNCIKSHAVPDTKELEKFLLSRLARHKRPTSYEFVTVPLRDASGKAHKSALRKERLHAVVAAGKR